MWLVCCRFLTISPSYLAIAHSACLVCATLDKVGSCVTAELNGTCRNNELHFHMHVNTSVISTLWPLTCLDKCQIDRQASPAAFQMQAVLNCVVSGTLQRCKPYRPHQHVKNSSCSTCMQIASLAEVLPASRNYRATLL